MFKINKLISYFFKKKEQESTIATEDKDLVLISVLMDCKTNKIASIIDAYPYDIEDNRMIKQAESLGLMLNQLCGDSIGLTELMLNNIELLKKNSNNNLLFYNNVLFFWQRSLEQRNKGSKDDDLPLIRPTQVFKH